MNTHPEFEDLSAFVDGEAPQWRDHVEICAACRADIDRLRAVSAAVGLSVPPVADDARDRAVAVALEAAGPLPVPVSAAESDAVATARVHRLPPIGPTTPVSSIPLNSLKKGRRANGPWLVALGSVAAVLLAVVVGAAVLRTPGGGNETQTLASGSPDAAEKAATSGSGTSGSGTSGSGTSDSGASAPGPAAYDLRQSATAGAGGVSGADLGPVDDQSQLAAKAGAALQQVPPAAPAPAVASAAAGSSARPPSQDNSLAGTAVGTRPCEEQVRAARPELREVVYFATATSRGRPAFVLAFATGPSPGPVTVLAVAQDGCVIVAETALP